MTKTTDPATLVERLRTDVLWHQRRGNDTIARDCQEAADEIERLRGLYEQLLFAVGSKYHGETRHQTALRYIKQAEAPQVSAPQCDGPNAKRALA